MEKINELITKLLGKKYYRNNFVVTSSLEDNKQTLKIIISYTLDHKNEIIHTFIFVAPNWLYKVSKAYVFDFECVQLQPLNHYDLELTKDICEIVKEYARF